MLDRYLIGYDDLCNRAGAPHVRRIVGTFLVEIAEWCAQSNLPPLNALAVNSTTRIPGDGYDGAGGFQMVNWPTEAEQSIRYRQYPLRAP